MITVYLLYTIPIVAISFDAIGSGVCGFVAFSTVWMIYTRPVHALPEFYTSGFAPWISVTITTLRTPYAQCYEGK